MPNAATSSRKIGILLANLGGPDSLEAVRPFLYNLFSDPDIFRFPLPWITQRLFAYLLSTSREKEAQSNYAEIGGRSPILPLTQQQGTLLEESLQAAGLNAKVYLAMRYWHPFTQEAVRQMADDGVEEIIFLPLYPQFSYTTTGSSLNELKRCLAKEPRLRSTPLRMVNTYYDDPQFIQAVADTVRDALQEKTWGCHPQDVTVLFSAHSLPRRFVIRNKDPYPQQIEATCRLVMDHFPGMKWDLAYQSKVGNLVWLGPQTDGVLAYYSATGVDNVLMVPIAFVSDHVETLFEIDLEYIPEAEELGLHHCHRAAALNDHPRFIQALAAQVMTFFPELATQTQPSSSTGEPVAV